jgi:predicted dehydrogenase
MSHDISRRSFIAGGAAATVGLSAFAQTPGAPPSERIRIGVIGTANRGGQLIEAILENRDQAEIVALCDVSATAMEKAKKDVPGEVATYSDYRKLLEHKDLDAVAIATPDHWHALQCIDACRAGKDVYVEKPLAQTIVEGRRMIEVARETNRIVQVGLMRRSSVLYTRLHDFLKEPGIGKVTVARAYRLSNMFPNGIGKAQDQEPPADLDWDMWLGPREKRPYRPTITPYKFRWWDGYSSQLGNWGVHYFDLIRWMLDEVGPVSVSAHGGRFAIDDDRTVPDTLETVFEFASGRLVIFGQYEASGKKMWEFGDIELRGTNGTVYSTTRKYEVIPETGGQYGDKQPKMEGKTETSQQDDTTAAHMRNFFDCIKSRNRPNCDVEEGHRSTLMAHLGNIALATRARLDWDPVNERFTNNEEANKLLHYEYRSPWTLG